MKRIPYLVLGGFLCLAGCERSDTQKIREENAVPPETSTIPKSNSSREVVEAFANIGPTQGNEVQGRVVFRKEGDAVRIIAHFKGLEPGVHGFHIHEKGDCSASDGSSAGDHYNPDNQPHAAPDAVKRHIGDLGNIIANQNGEASYDKLDRWVKLDGEHSIIGRSVVIHADPDDFVTQPSGNAGKRVGCGVIQGL